MDVRHDDGRPRPGAVQAHAAPLQHLAGDGPLVGPHVEHPLPGHQVKAVRVVAKLGVGSAQIVAWRRSG